MLGAGQGHGGQPPRATPTPQTLVCSRSQMFSLTPHSFACKPKCMRWLRRRVPAWAAPCFRPSSTGPCPQALQLSQRSSSPLAMQECRVHLSAYPCPRCPPSLFLLSLQLPAGGGDGCCRRREHLLFCATPVDQPRGVVSPAGGLSGPQRAGRQTLAGSEGGGQGSCRLAEWIGGSRLQNARCQLRLPVGTCWHLPFAGKCWEASPRMARNGSLPSYPHRRVHCSKRAVARLAANAQLRGVRSPCAWHAAASKGP